MIINQLNTKHLVTLAYTTLCTTYKDIFISQKEENLLPGGSLYNKARNAWKNKKLRLRQKLILSSPSERTKTMNTELEMSSNYHHGQEPQQNVLTPVHFNGGAYRQVPPQNHHQIPTHFTGTGYEHQSTPNRRLPVDMYQATSPYIRTTPPSTG